MKISRLFDVFLSFSVSTFAGTLHVSMLASCKGSNDAGGVQRGLEGFGMFSGAFVLARPKLNGSSKVQSNFFQTFQLAKCPFYVLCQVSGHAIIDMSGETFATSPFTSSLRTRKSFFSRRTRRTRCRSTSFQGGGRAPDTWAPHKFHGDLTIRRDSPNLRLLTIST